MFPIYSPRASILSNQWVFPQQSFSEEIILAPALCLPTSYPFFCRKERNVRNRRQEKKNTSDLLQKKRTLPPHKQETQAPESSLASKLEKRSIEMRSNFTSHSFSEIGTSLTWALLSHDDSSMFISPSSSYLKNCFWQRRVEVECKFSLDLGPKVFNTSAMSTLYNLKLWIAIYRH